MKRLLTFLAVLGLLFYSSSCEKHQLQDDTDVSGNVNPTPGPSENEKPEKPVKPDPAVYPEGLDVSEHMYTHSDGKKTRYFVAKADFQKNPNLKFTVTQNMPKATPSKVYESFDSDYGIPYVITNAGYFAGSTSMSLIIVNNFCSVIAPLSITWPNYEHPEANVYVTRAAIGQMPDGKMDIAWVYCCDPTSRHHYSYPEPHPNNEKTKTFAKEPPKQDASGAKLWTPEWAVGGGPMLVKDGHDIAMDSYWKECLNSGGTAGASRVPRTGAGLDKDGNLILIVCDGRNMKGSAGFTLTEFAEVFIKHGAVKAMNLDGGGSSAMIGKNGELLNWPSDSGSGNTAVERRVTSCIAISCLPSE